METCGSDYSWVWKWPYYLQADHRSEENTRGFYHRSSRSRDLTAGEPRGVLITVTTLGMKWQSKSFSVPVRELSLLLLFLILPLIFGGEPSGFLKARVLEVEGVILLHETPVFASLLSPLSVWPNETSKVYVSLCLPICFYSVLRDYLFICLEGRGIIVKIFLRIIELLK